MRVLSDLRAVVFGGWLAIAGCAPENVSLDPPPREGLVGACGATPTALAALSGILPDRLGIDESNLYALTSTEVDSAVANSLWKIPKDGSAPQRLLTTTTPMESVVLYGGPEVTEVVWTEGSPADDGGATGSVWSFDLFASNGPRLLASGRRSPTSVVVIDPHVYWVEEAVDPSGPSVAAIMETSTTGGPVTRVETLEANQLPQTLLAFDMGYAPEDEVRALFWTMWNPKLGDERTAELVEYRVPAGPETRITGPDAGGAAAIALDIYAPGILYSGPSSISEVTVAADGGLGLPRRFVATGGFVDRIRTYDADVYFVDRATGSLMAAPRPGADAQAPRTVARSVDPAAAFQVDSACAYWVDARVAAIKMVTKR
jgi:hypothetical protein